MKRLRSTVIGADNRPEVVLMTLDERAQHPGPIGDIVWRAAAIAAAEGLPDDVPLEQVADLWTDWQRSNREGERRPCPFPAFYRRTEERLA